ncbi:MAG: STAS domain-containing protein [Acidimicrobiia bacterium]
MKPLARLMVETVGGVTVARLSGEVDLSNVDDVGATLLEAVRPELDCLVVDLSETTYLDSTGVRLLFDLAMRLQTRRQVLRIVVADAAIVRRVLILTKLDEAVPFHESIEQALAAVEAARTDGSIEQ